MRPRFAALVFFCLPFTALSFSGCVQDASSPSAARAVTLMIALLRDQSPEIRRTAAESLGKIGDRSAVGFVLPLADDSDPAVRAAAVQALGRLASRPTQEVIVALARSLEDPVDAIKLTASMAIGEVEPDPAQLKPVANLLHSPDSKVRRAAVHALLQVDAGDKLPELVVALRDVDTDVRQGAVAALGESGRPAMTAELLRRLAEDASPAVRTEAAYHLGKVGDRDVRLALGRAAARDAERGVRRWADAALKSLRGTD